MIIHDEIERFEQSTHNLLVILKNISKKTCASFSTERFIYPKMVKSEGYTRLVVVKVENGWIFRIRKFPFKKVNKKGGGLKL